MRKLILCVDRDDDVGTKGGKNTPIIGRTKILNAAISLGLSDPEDSDTNTILAGVQIYEKLKSQGEDVEVALIGGDSNLGFRADEALSTQLEVVLSSTKPDGVILVSDGSEDESFYPVISSRVRIISLRRVFVKQAPDIERTIHIVLKTLDDEKMKKKILIPVALAFLVYGLFAISGLGNMGLGAITVTLGAYFIVRAYRLEESVSSLFSDLRTGIISSRISVPFTMIAFVFVMGGIVFGFGSVQSHIETGTSFEMVVEFLHSSIWWFVTAGFALGIGKALDTYFKEDKFNWFFFSFSLSLLALGSIISGSLYLFKIFASYELDGTLDLLFIQKAFFFMVSGVGIAIFGGYIHHYIKEKEAKERAEKALSSEA